MNNARTSCPNCGANIVPPKNRKKDAYHTCRYCGTLLHMEPTPTPEGSNDSTGFYWQIEISDTADKGGSKNKTRFWPLALIPGLLIPPVVLFVNFSGFYLPGLFSSGKVVCSGTELVTLLKKNITGVEARENCRVILNNVSVESDHIAITLKDNANITAINSRVTAKDTAVRAADNARISLVNSTIMSDTTAFHSSGEARISVTNCTARGKKNLSIKENRGRIKFHNSSAKGNRIIR